ncbi:unnamed protein product [Prorocentrum cordatum]|uniref:Phospholipase B-like n=1 Tax=Prorocentrum cordatum TaxID=2364126 RepID=A0ABN9UB38_9DINO|nr:unnamed protein product [Polarella glacialis]|mmetsp:Transcript_81183/g.219954  ORF Transcript_81183/g.219954 Transcript_81183/m.219954 type:complete len:497 (+) Transcript_81183:80-1570(+)
MTWSRDLNARGVEILAREALKDRAATADAAALGAGWSRELNAKGAELLEREAGGRGPEAEPRPTASAATRWLRSWLCSPASRGQGVDEVAEEHRNASRARELGAGWSRGLNAHGLQLLGEGEFAQYCDAITAVPPGAVWSRELNSRAAELDDPITRHYDAATSSCPSTWSRNLNAKALEAVATETVEGHFDAVTRAPPGSTWSRELNVKALRAVGASTCDGQAGMWLRELHLKGPEMEEDRAARCIWKHYDAITAVPATPTTWSRGVNASALAQIEAAGAMEPIQKHYDAITAASAGASWCRVLNAAPIDIAGKTLAEAQHDTVTRSCSGAWSKDLNKKATDAHFLASFEKHCDAITIVPAAWSRGLNAKVMEADAQRSLERHYDNVTRAATGVSWRRELSLLAAEAPDEQEEPGGAGPLRQDALPPDSKPCGRGRLDSDVSTAASMSRQGTERTLSWADDDFEDDLSYKAAAGGAWGLRARCQSIPEGHWELHEA